MSIKSASRVMDNRSEKINATLKITVIDSVRNLILDNDSNDFIVDGKIPFFVFSRGSKGDAMIASFGKENHAEMEEKIEGFAEMEDSQKSLLRERFMFEMLLNPLDEEEESVTLWAVGFLAGNRERMIELKSSDPNVPSYGGTMSVITFADNSDAIVTVDLGDHRGEGTLASTKNIPGQNHIQLNKAQTKSLSRDQIMEMSETIHGNPFENVNFIEGIDEEGFLVGLMMHKYI